MIQDTLVWKYEFKSHLCSLNNWNEIHLDKKLTLTILFICHFFRLIIFLLFFSLSFPPSFFFSVSFFIIVRFFKNLHLFFFLLVFLFSASFSTPPFSFLVISFNTHTHTHTHAYIYIYIYIYIFSSLFKLFSSFKSIISILFQNYLLRNMTWKLCLKKKYYFINIVWFASIVMISTCKCRIYLCNKRIFKTNFSSKNNGSFVT